MEIERDIDDVRIWKNESYKKKEDIMLVFCTASLSYQVALWTVQ